ncbi:mannose-1-phosphate guanylyltransferase/mannose-6-phosphate isomerase [Kushneria indalinina]|uniref:mannose-1-phosphate guanylyltransferase n=1 Tax=Kushneria indalinina DSM 14324 TaxID=1122140 RepID=A0A3D9DU25_9GAMM|nr:mannose-1-phosphate guanylyltransferase/mannose-6-phosphate isomerase [Kushneria indalinina]REC94290.1 mannose-1-phosphate guanylyltransferase [Kushneria indalinina DSM 14324]
MRLFPVIMAGGSGTRLWPLSRPHYPKQFIALTDEGESMLQQTIKRLDGLEHLAPLLICNEEHRFLAAEQLRVMGAQHSGILLEPFGRNTAPAIALAAIKSMAKGDDPVLLVLAADHYMDDVNAFQKAALQAQAAAEKGYLVTFGIKPTHAETGYGYVKAGQHGPQDYASVYSFVEKPDAVTAQRYLAEGGYYWNSGMFMFKASRYLEELGKYRPDILEACQRSMAHVRADMDFLRIDTVAFEACPSESIDYAVMEHTDSAVVVPMEAGWSDVGSWSAVWEVNDKDDVGNVSHGDVAIHQSSNCLAYSQSRLVSLIGLDNIMVVETKDAVLVASRDNAQEVKTLVERLKAEQRKEVSQHREVYRPWGKYDAIDCEPRYQVKRITVNPGQRLSVQMHHHRSEHWVVVSGTALVGINGEEQLVAENQSVYIPLGATHFMANPGKIPLELIEVQSGAYLGEDDIVRFEDIYGRQ